MDVFNSENEPGEDEIRGADILLALREVDVDYEDPPYEDISLVYLDERGNFKSFFSPNTPLELGWFGYFLGKCTWLTTLSINASSLREFELDEIKIFFQGLGRNKSIFEFSMCWFDDAQLVESLGIFLRDNTKLCQLTIDNCDFEVNGWRLLAQCLKDRPVKSIEYASFGTNPDMEAVCDELMDDELVAEIISSFESYSSLKRLSIQQTQMGYKGCVALANLLGNSSLVYLDLAQNQIDDRGVEVLLPSIHKTGEQLLHLDMKHNHISGRKFLDIFSLFREKDINGYWLNTELADLLAQGDFGVEELYKYELKLLPNLARMFDNAHNDHSRRGYRMQNRYANVSHNIIYNFLRNVPMG